MKYINALINWFWSDPWETGRNIDQVSDQALLERLGLYRFLVCMIALFVVYNQDSHVLTIDIHGHPFFFYDRRTWYFALLDIKHTYPLFDFLNFYIAMIAFFLAAIGYRFRVSMTVAILSLFYIQASRSALIGNYHHVLITWGHVLPILLFSRAGEAFSVDGPGKRPLERWEAIWPVRLIQIAIMLFYFSAGLAKFREAGLGWVIDGSGIQRTLLSRWQSNALFFEYGMTLAAYPKICWLLSLGLVILELIFPLLLLMRWKVFNWFMVVSFTLFHLITRFVIGLPFHFNSILLLIYVDHAPWIFSFTDKMKNAIGAKEKN